MAPAEGKRHEYQQYKGPEAENGLDLSKQVPQPRVRGLGMCQVLEITCRERVDNRQSEQRGANKFKGPDMACHAENLCRTIPARNSQSRVRKNAYLPCLKRRRKILSCHETPSISAGCGCIRALLRRA